MTQPRHRRPPDQGRATDEDWMQLTLLGSYASGLAYARQRLHELRGRLGENRHTLALSLRQLEAAWYEVWYEDLSDPVSRWSPLKAGVAKDYSELVDACDAQAPVTRPEPDLAAALTANIRRILDAWDRGDPRVLQAHDRIWREMPVLARVNQFAAMREAMRKAVATECREPFDANILLLVRALNEPESVAGPAVVPETAPASPSLSPVHPDRVPTRRRLQAPLD